MELLPPESQAMILSSISALTVVGIPAIVWGIGSAYRSYCQQLKCKYETEFGIKPPDYLSISDLRRELSNRRITRHQYTV